MAAPMSFTYESSIRRLKRIVEVLRQSPRGMTRQQLAKAAAIAQASLGLYLAHLRGTETAPRQIRIGDWLRQLDNRGNFTPVFVAGDEPDEPRPLAFTNAERSRRYRTKRRDDQVASATASQEENIE